MFLTYFLDYFVMFLIYFVTFLTYFVFVMFLTHFVMFLTHFVMFLKIQESTTAVFPAEGTADDGDGEEAAA